MTITLLNTDEQYRAALARVGQIFNAPPGSPEENEAEVLTLLIEDYEDRHYPMPPPHPIEAIKFRMEQLGMSAADLAVVIGHRGRVSEILSGKRKLSLAMIRRLSRDLRIPADILVQEYEVEASA